MPYDVKKGISQVLLHLLQDPEHVPLLDELEVTLRDFLYELLVLSRCPQLHQGLICLGVAHVKVFTVYLGPRAI